MKYNIVWDKLLNLNIFNEEIFENEVELYHSKLNKYGIPLECRSDYTKIDWLCWTTVMTDCPKYREDVFEAMYRYINETPDRAPMTDWHYTSEPRQQKFQNRSVVGGLFINMLQ